ncbi:MAG: hypothetical protein AAF360_09860 [Pseudomonadota bacterium]
MHVDLRFATLDDQSIRTDRAANFFVCQLIVVRRRFRSRCLILQQKMGRMALKQNAPIQVPAPVKKTHRFGAK